MIYDDSETLIDSNYNSLDILTLKLHYGSTQDFLSHVHTDKYNHFLNEVSSLNKLNASGYSGNEPKDLNQQLIAMASREFGFVIM